MHAASATAAAAAAAAEAVGAVSPHHFTKKVLIVESHAKARKIRTYLGGDWVVLASYGHVRDLVPQPGSVNPDNGFAMLWASNARQQQIMDVIRIAVTGARQVVLATDPDREGEAISWHIHDILQVRTVQD